MDDADLVRAGYRDKATDLVAKRVKEARDAGMDGIVCAPQETGAVRAIVGPEMIIVTPGIRPSGSPPNDQKRAMTPGEAMAAGADYLVVGRPITAALDPVSAAATVQAEIGQALRGD
jgi:orotidine-5'-phosphate decarboxylase